MLSVTIAAVAAAIVIIVSITHRGRGDRSHLLRAAALTLLAAVVLREASVWVGHYPIFDLGKRLAILASETSMILLVLTFRKRSIKRSTAQRIWAAATALGLVQVVLAFFTPTLPDGTLPAYSDVIGDSIAVPYYGINQLTLVAFALVVGIGCLRALRSKAQPLAARASLALMVAASGFAVLYAAVGTGLLIGLQAPNDALIQRGLLLGTVACFLAGLIVSGAHKIVVDGQETLAIAAATDIVEPLWNAAVKLHPSVVLPEVPTNRRDRLIRLAVETNDALALIRSDSGALVATVSDAYSQDPRLDARLLMCLLGEDALPELPKRHRDGSVKRLTRRLKDETLAAAIHDLYRLRLEFMNSRDAGAPPVQTASA